MKIPASILALFLCVFGGVSSAWGQSPLPLDSVTHKVTFQGVVQVPGASQAELYSRAREWFAVSFGSSKAVLEMDDREAGKLIGNAVGKYSQLFMGKAMPTDLWRTIKIQVKDGRYQYVLTNFATCISKPQADAQPIELSLTPASFDKHGRPKPYMASMFAGVQQSAESQIVSLRAAMAAPPKKADW